MNHDQLITMLNDIQTTIIRSSTDAKLVCDLLKDINDMRMKIVSDRLKK
jgi:hypothetical protein